MKRTRGKVILLMICILVLTMVSGGIATALEVKEPVIEMPLTNFEIHRATLKAKSQMVRDETVGLLQQIGYAIEDWASYLAIATNPGGVYDTGAVEEEKVNLSVQFTFWPGEKLDGAIGFVPKTNRYYTGIQHNFEEIPFLGNKINNLGIGTGISCEPDFSNLGYIVWAYWVIGQ